MGLKLPAIGGKDSMSGTFNDIDVPPTLCSFAVGISDMKHVVTPELKKVGNYLYLLEVKPDKMEMPNYRMLLAMYKVLRQAVGRGAIKSAYAVGFGGIAEAVSKMAFGNRLGVCFDGKIDVDELFEKKYGAIVVEVENCGELPAVARKIGRVTDDGVFEIGEERIAMDEMLQAWTSRLEDIFPTKSNVESTPVENKPLYTAKKVYVCKHKVAKTQSVYPHIPGYQLRVRLGAGIPACGCRSGNARVPQSESQSDTRERRCFRPCHRREPDGDDSRRLFGRR